MKHIVAVLFAGFVLLLAAPIGRAEEVEAFLRRCAEGKFTAADFHENFSGIIFEGEGKTIFDKGKIDEIVEGIKSAGDKFKVTVVEFVLVSKNETPVGDGKRALISTITKVKSKLKIEDDEVMKDQVFHEVLIRSEDGKLQYLKGVAVEK
jgi:hypothetical protein